MSGEPHDVEYPEELRYKAVVFDLDGVITKTSHLHEKAWKQVFDEYLKQKSNFREFSHEDYLKYVDGLPRTEGAAKFLESRGIFIERGDFSDSSERDTIYAIGHRKDKIFNSIIETQKIPIYESTVNFIKQLKFKGIKIAVASSSKHCKHVLMLTELEHYFDAAVDGIVTEGLKLKGKPSPDIFTKCCEVLGVTPEESIMLEDAISGVQAGRNGKFGLVIGIDRGGNRDALFSNGADLVISDVSQISIWSVNDIFPYRNSEWTLNFDSYNPSIGKFKETLTTLGNGYLATRGSPEEVTREEETVRYPGTYLGGGYNRVKSNIHGKIVDTEELVNFPNWTCITFRSSNLCKFFNWGDDDFQILSYNQHINIKEGISVRKFTVRDPEGKVTTIVTQRFVHIRSRNLAAIKYNIIPENWSGSIQILSQIDGSVRNRGVERYREYESKMFDVIDSGTFSAGTKEAMFLTVRTNQSHFEVCTSALTTVYSGTNILDCESKIIKESEKIGVLKTVNVREGCMIVVEKFVSIASSRDRGFLNAMEGSKNEIQRVVNNRFYWLFATHQMWWNTIWNRTDIKIHLGEDKRSEKPMNPINHSDLLDKYRRSGATSLNAEELQFILRFHAFHLVQSCNTNSIGIDAGVPARGLHGEAYRGHIFWDELFVLTTYNLRIPEASRNLLLYRYNRLNAARDVARSYGAQGACFPWQSGSTGHEETSKTHFNPLDKRWYPDNSFLQQHINIAVFYNVWKYVTTTDDFAFLSLYGAEMMLEIARFWSCKCSFNEKTGRYEIVGVMGPDEFHEIDPISKTPGLRNNSYTNVMVAWLFEKALSMLNVLSPLRKSELLSILRISEKELERWRHITQKMTVIFHDDMVMSQFEGYFGLKELDWDKYRSKYSNITRLDRILRAEGDSPDNFKVSKQADVCMLFYLLTHDELIDTLGKMGYPYNRDLINKNIQYYMQRTSHGSTLSYVVFSFISYPFSIEEGWNLYKNFLLSDICDIQGGTTAEGIHVVPMSASINMLLYQLCGIDTSKKELKIDPKLPHEVKELEFRFQFKGRWLWTKVTHRHVCIKVDEGGKSSRVPVMFQNRVYKIIPGSITKL